MKFLHFLPLAGTAIAFVIPNQDVLESHVFESNGVREMSNALDDALESHELQEFLEDWSVIGEGSDGIYDKDNADPDKVPDADHSPLPHIRIDIESLFHGPSEDPSDDSFDGIPSHLGISHEMEDSEDDVAPFVIPSDQTGGHDKPSLTVYEMIVKSKYTTKLAELVNNDTELIDVLNKSDASLTVFAPTDKAFAKIPDHGHKPSKELIRKFLLNHISGDFYPAKKVLKAYTIPTLLEEKSLGGLQRLVIKLGPHGLTVNFFSRVVAANIFATNGVIHGVDNLVFLPPPTLPIVEATPSVFSTLGLGLFKTGLFKALGDLPHTGSTFFAPTNRGFRALGPKINAFLFSKYGTKYLKALLKYHVVHNATLYSDAFYHGEGMESPVSSADGDFAHGESGHKHFDLPTLLEDRKLPVAIKKLGPFTSIVVNDFVKVAFSDVPTKDGVIHVVNHVLIPPRNDDDSAESLEWISNDEHSVEDLMERLEPYLDSDVDSDEAVDMSMDEDEFLNLGSHDINSAYPDWSKLYL